jgi:hypothetical protein
LNRQLGWKRFLYIQKIPGSPSLRTSGEGTFQSDKIVGAATLLSESPHLKNFKYLIIMNLPIGTPLALKMASTLK